MQLNTSDVFTLVGISSHSNVCVIKSAPNYFGALQLPFHRAMHLALPSCTIYLHVLHSFRVTASKYQVITVAAASLFSLLE